MINIRFGLPKKEVVNKEKFPDQPVVTMEAVEDKGHNRRFVLNKKAVELLNVVPGESHIAFAFDGMNAAYISNNMTEDSFLLGKNKAFSNKKYYDHITKIYSLDLSYDNYFELTDAIPVGDTTVYRMKHVQIDEAPVRTDNPVTDKEIEHLVEEEARHVDRRDWGFWNGRSGFARCGRRPFESYGTLWDSNVYGSRSYCANPLRHTGRYVELWCCNVLRDDRGASI